MKKILIVDPLSLKGHINYNYGIINAAAKHYQISVITNENHNKRLKEKGISNDVFFTVYPDRWGIEELSKKHNKIIYHFLYRFYIVKILLLVIKSQKQFDFILFTSIDIFSFSFFSYLFKKPCAVVDHGIGYITTSNAYKLFWKLSNSQITLIVLEDFIKEMVNKYLPNVQVGIVHHPLPTRNIYNSDNIDKSFPNILVFAPSNSNDESYLKKICNAFNENSFCFYAKSKSFEYDRNNIHIFSGFISPEKYNELFTRSSFILLPYESNYNYRVSAVMFEALIENKVVLLLNNNTLYNYYKLFPNNIILLNNNDSLEEVIMRNSIVPSILPNLHEYSTKSISMQIEKIIN